MDFWRASHLLSKRKWFIILSLVVTGVLTYGASRVVGQQWQATVKFVSATPITPTGQGPGENSRWVDPKLDVQINKNEATKYETIVRSRPVIEAAQKQLGSTPIAGAGLFVVSTTPKVYDLQVKDANPQRAQKIANAVADAFLKQTQDMDSANYQNTVNILQDQLNEADVKVSAARKKLEKYRLDHEIVGQSAQQTMDQAFVRARDYKLKLEDNKQQIAQARAQLSLKQIEFSHLKETVELKIAPPQNPILRTIDDEIFTAQRTLDTDKKRYGDIHPKVKQDQEALDDLKAKRKSEEARQVAAINQQPNPNYARVKSEIDQLQQAMAGLQAQAPLLAAAINTAQAEVNKYKNVDFPLAQLNSDLAQKLEIRSSLSARLNNANMGLDISKQQTPLRILDKSSNTNAAVNLSEGRTVKIVLLAMVAALVCVCSLIIALDRIDRRVRTVKEAEFSLPTKVLAAIPQPAGAVSYATLARATELHPQSLHSEAYRFLGLHLLNSRSPGVRSIMVLSAKAEQGSTTTVTNLGITLAQAGKKVIIVDANVRTPELHQVFQTENDFGFTDLLSNPDAETLEHALHSTSVPNLSVIPSGPQPLNPWELFRSDNMRLVSNTLHQIADYVIYDTPSALLFTDALNLAPIVDAAFLCVRALEPLSGSEQRLIELLEEANVTVMGSVINHVPTAVLEGYHNYQHYYAPAGIGTAPGVIGSKEVAVAAPPKSLVDMPGNGTGRNGANGNGIH